MRKPCRKTLIVKLLGCVLGFQMLTSQIKNLWHLEGCYKIVDLGHDYYLFKFELQSDYRNVLEGGPWIIGGHDLTVRQWYPNFNPKSDEIQKVLEWIRLLGLPVKYYNFLALTRMTSHIGKVVRFDKHTEEAIRSCYARVCVELDLTKPLLSKIKVGKLLLSVEYEGINLLCFHYGKCITLVITSNLGKVWALSAVYASPVPTVKEIFWDFLRNFNELDNTPWVLISDFNQIISYNKKQGRGHESCNKMLKFLSVVQTRGLIDLRAVGCQFTWTNRQPSSTLIKKRFDRALCNSDWRQSFEEAMVHNLPRIRNDHCPLLLCLTGMSTANHTMRSFRFEFAWQLHQRFSDFMRLNWNNESNLSSNLENFTSIVRVWNKTCFENIFKWKRLLIAKIRGTQKALESNPNLFLFELECKLLAEYEQTLLQEKALWFQKSRFKWIQMEDKNTKFF
ncbi:hypothetical protein REPUB_Repub05bG0085400 [Reevesia pubescens]